MSSTTNSIIGIGAEVYALLTASKELSAIVGNRIYPMIADEGTTFPFVVYQRSGTAAAGDKDGSEQRVAVTVTIAADNYRASVEAATAALDALQNHTTEHVDDIRLDSAAEAWYNDTFLQTLNFSLLWHKN